ncbi:receptor-like protein kinase FERONIA [Quercus lobata]|uniref:Protein kinase domain-containing protein n=1 Tax=Quercus lobata TaxID=97700 RepID=A0A7N2KYZ1_QUELO|nr:receptor-like protein kinase FERONIA [Quercus lobata]
MRNPPHLLFFFFLQLASGLRPPYSPTINITLNCGFSGNTSARDNRIWLGDINSDFGPFELQNNSSVISEAAKQPTEVDPIPYYTARLSYSEFTYMFSVTAGQLFIRLYFFPASYQNFDRSKAFFSVKAGSYTLLSNFSAALTVDADALSLEGFSREFCVNIVENARFLNITFTPSPGNLDAYAFVNGIELVSVPSNLYYSEDISTEIKLIGQSTPYTIEKSHALETVYRLNIGGRMISPTEDTGMYRSWSDDDAAYLTSSEKGFVDRNTTIRLRFSKISNYTAPEEVYITALTMGPNKTINKSNNLTWEFSVDAGFNYLVRLHFCEFQVEITEEGDRDFYIFIADQIAEERADVLSWSGGNGIPVYKDYAVLMFGEGNKKKLNLSVALQANPDDRMTKYSDAILNGLEIFKISDLINNLAGPNPDPLPTPKVVAIPFPIQPRKVKSNHTTIIPIVVGLFSGIVVLSILGFFIFQRGRRVDKDAKSSSTILPSDLCRCFSLSEIKAATNNFDKLFIIGVGGFGDVYKGYIDGGETCVAIKRLKPGSQQGAHEFKTEIEMLSQLRHLHLVPLIGYCNHGNEMILVYDYMAHGTLRDHLYNTDNPPLSWEQRLQICIGAARGLQYLHIGAKQMIIHRDVKSTNILLDEKWVAKVSDFGLSKLGPTSVSMTHVSTVVKGSIGYLDPEYYRRQQLTEKSDVYSFGVVLCEVLCARPPLIRNVDKERVSLAEWAQQCYHNGKLDQIVDPFLSGKIVPECLKKFGEITVNCLLDDGIKRPSMNDVVWGLEFALQLQESKRDSGVQIFEIEGHIEKVLLQRSAIEDCEKVFTSSGGRGSNGESTSCRVNIASNGDQSSANETSDSSNLIRETVFSELMSQKGR